MGYFDGKQGLILGVATDRSIAWAIAKEIMDQGGVCGFTHLPDKPEDDKKKNRRRVSQLTDQYPNHAKFLVPLEAVVVTVKVPGPTLTVAEVANGDVWPPPSAFK